MLHAGLAGERIFMSINWDSLRATEFPVADRWAYFDHAAQAPLPRRSAEVSATFVRRADAGWRRGLARP